LLLGLLSAWLRKIRTGKLLEARAVTSSCSSIEEFTLCQLGWILTSCLFPLLIYTRDVLTYHRRVKATAQHYFGVLCSRCKAKIPVPPRIATQQLTSKSDQDIQPRGFSVRCKVCNEEDVYGVNQIQEFQGPPRTRIHVSNHLRKTQGDSKLGAEGGAHT
jgi:hypothetical protein